jgi:hypothetical protein
MSFLEFSAGAKFLLRYAGVLKILKYQVQEINLKSTLKKNKFYRTKIFRSDLQSSKVIFLVHGMSGHGIDDLRIIELAQNLTSLGFTVVVPEFQEIKLLNISTETIENIRDAFLSIRKNHFQDSEIGFFSISFGAGMGLVTFSNPEIAKEISVLCVLGGFYNVRNMAIYALDNFYNDDYAPLVIYYNFLSKADKYFVKLNPVLYALALDNGLRLKGTGNEKAPKLIEKLLKKEKEVLHKFLNNTEFRESFRDGIDQASSVISKNISPEFFVSNIKAKVSIIHGKNDFVIPEEESIRLKDHLKRENIEHRHCITSLLSHGDKVSYMNKFQEIPKLANSFGYFFNHV